MPKYRVEFERRQEACIVIEAADEDAAWDTLVKPVECDWDSFGMVIVEVDQLEADDAEA